MDRKTRVEKQMKKIRAFRIKERAAENKVRKLKAELDKEMYPSKPIRNLPHVPGMLVSMEIVDSVEVDQDIQYEYKDWTRLAKVVEKSEGARPRLQILDVSKTPYENVPVSKVKENRLYKA